MDLSWGLKGLREDFSHIPPLRLTHTPTHGAVHRCFSSTWSLRNAPTVGDNAVPAPILLHSASPESGRSLTPTQTHTLQLECAEAVLHKFFTWERRGMSSIWGWWTRDAHKKQPVYNGLKLYGFFWVFMSGKQAVNETDVWVFSKYPYKARTFERNLD